MSEWGRCPKCGQYGFMGGHVCDPVWEATLLDWFKNDGKDAWQKVRADSAKEAAEIFAENEDVTNAEFTETRYVVIRDSEGELHYFCVCGEMEPYYTAGQVTPEEATREQNAAD
jgi:hypothetical protein